MKRRRPARTDNEINLFCPILLQEIQGEVRKSKRGVTVPAGSQYGSKFFQEKKTRKVRIGCPVIPGNVLFLLFLPLPVTSRRFCGLGGIIRVGM